METTVTYSVDTYDFMFSSSDADTDDTTFRVDTKVTGDCLHYTQIVGKFLQFIRASGYDYINGFTVHTGGDSDGTFVGTDDI